MSKAVVTGMIATYPVGGVVWDYGHYALALEELGFDVFYLEDTGGPTYNPAERGYSSDPSFALDFLKSSLRQLSPGLEEQWHFRAMDGRVHGLGQRVLQQILREAAVFLNVSGSALMRDEYMLSRRKVLIDTDPGYNHFVNYPKWDSNPGWMGTHGYRAHDFFFTYAEKIGDSDCGLPSLGLPWHATRPVVVGKIWDSPIVGNAWTTVMTWDNFRKAICGNGTSYGTKEREFDKIELLPQLVDSKLEVAVGGSSPPVERWRQLGWSVIDAHEVSDSAAKYRYYVQHSRGEFSVAKNVYVATRSGWFSCRSVCYLAAGKPVVIQDTGFSDVLPTGKGLLAFSTLEEAVAAVRAVDSDLESHQKAARALAQSHFSPEVVLGELLNQIGL